MTTITIRDITTGDVHALPSDTLCYLGRDVAWDAASGGADGLPDDDAIDLATARHIARGRVLLVKSTDTTDDGQRIWWASEIVAEPAA